MEVRLAVDGVIVLEREPMMLDPLLLGRIDLGVSPAAEFAAEGSGCGSSSSFSPTFTSKGDGESPMVLIARRACAGREPRADGGFSDVACQVTRGLDAPESPAPRGDCVGDDSAEALTF